MATTPHKNSNTQMANTSSIKLDNANQFWGVCIGLTSEVKFSIRLQRRPCCYPCELAGVRQQFSVSDASSDWPGLRRGLSSKKKAGVTPSRFAISCKRPAPTRLTPRSHFWIC